MADPDRSEVVGPTWRLTGLQRWLPVALLPVFVLQALQRATDVSSGTAASTVDRFVLVLSLIGATALLLGLVVAWRTRVTLLAAGVEIRSVRRRLVPYTDVESAYRSRWSPGSVTLDLLDASKVVLPAPVAALKDPAPGLDEAVDLINARIRAARAAFGDGTPG